MKYKMYQIINLNKKKKEESKNLKICIHKGGKTAEIDY
jgi:hypothetical protein